MTTAQLIRMERRALEAHIAGEHGFTEAWPLLLNDTELAEFHAELHARGVTDVPHDHQ